uniref:DNA-directed DNA polymerase n=1 Tax=Romanomermis culicivorax TaxID=13658 RepID=A0A915I5A0_ROMCU
MVISMDSEITVNKDFNEQLRGVELLDVEYYIDKNLDTNISRTVGLCSSSPFFSFRVTFFVVYTYTRYRKMAVADSQMPVPSYGKIAKTQLSTGDPEIVREEIVKGSAPYVQMMKMMTDCETKAACTKAAHNTQTKGGGKAANQTTVLHDAARLYLNEKYRPALMSGNSCKMDDVQMAQTINLQAYRAELVQMSEHYQPRKLTELTTQKFDPQIFIPFVLIQASGEAMGNKSKYECTFRTRWCKFAQSWH